MTVIANAKLNLYLDIVGRREDGYHLLETVMQSITLSDVLDISFQESGGIEISCSAPHIPTDERNICYKAAKKYIDAAGISCGVKIDIHKRIPDGAGMGGGSADAAAVFRAMEEHFGALGEERLMVLAASVGADVPFCLAGGTRICTGIGENMQRTTAVEGCCFLIVMPDFTCPTGEAYARYDKAPIPAKNRLGEFAASLPYGFADKLYNSFEVLYADERINGIKDRLIASGAEGALLTGSGAAVFGAFGSREAAKAAAKQFPQYFTAVCEPTDKGVIISDKVDQKEVVI